MTESGLVIILALATLLAALAAGGWQWRKTQQAKRRGETSSFTRDDPNDHER